MLIQFVFSFFVFDRFGFWLIDQADKCWFLFKNSVARRLQNQG